MEQVENGTTFETLFSCPKLKFYLFSDHTNVLKLIMPIPTSFSFLIYFRFSVQEYAKKYNFEVELPQLYAEGTYDIDGRILLIPVKGNGRFHGNFSKFHSYAC